MAVNKVEFGDETLIDLTGDTVTPKNLLKGATAHGANGEPIEGEVDLNKKPDFTVDGSDPSSEFTEKDAYRSDRILLWEDDFNFFDDTKWCGKVDNASYASSGAEYTQAIFELTDENFKIEDSILKLKACHTEAEDAYILPRIMSKKSFRNCMIEAKVKIVTHSDGLAGGIWGMTLQNPSDASLHDVNFLDDHCLEVDICEPADEYADRVKQNVHYSDRGHTYYNTLKTTSFDNDWHIYTLDIIGDNYFVYYIDGVKTTELEVDFSTFRFGRSPLTDMGIQLYLDICRGTLDHSMNRNAEYHFDWVRVYSNIQQENVKANKITPLDINGEPLHSSWTNFYDSTNSKDENGKYVHYFQFKPSNASVLPEIRCAKLNGITNEGTGGKVDCANVFYLRKIAAFRPSFQIDTDLGTIQITIWDARIGNQLPYPDEAEGMAMIANQAAVTEYMQKFGQPADYMFRIKDVVTNEYYVIICINGELRFMREQSFT